MSELKSKSVEFTATYRALKKHDKYAPSYTITLSDAAGNKLVLSGAFQGSDTPRATTKVVNGGGEGKSMDPILELALARSYKVKMSWTGAQASIEVDGAAKTIDLGFAPTNIEVLCSTGELELKDIVFGD